MMVGILPILSDKYHPPKTDWMCGEIADASGDDADNLFCFLKSNHYGNHVYTYQCDKMCKRYGKYIVARAKYRMIHGSRYNSVMDIDEKLFISGYFHSNGVIPYLYEMYLDFLNQNINSRVSEAITFIFGDDGFGC